MTKYCHNKNNSNNIARSDFEPVEETFVSFICVYLIKI